MVSTAAAPICMSAGHGASLVGEVHNGTVAGGAGVSVSDGRESLGAGCGVLVAGDVA